MAKIHSELVRKAALGRIPLTGAFELSPLCNFNCGMCYVRESAGTVKRRGGIRPLSFWLDAAEQARDAGCMLPLLTGGEPFLYPHLRVLMERMTRMGMQVSINTNASLIDEKAIDWLVQSPPARINVTLYGAGREGYGRQCGDPSAFERVLHACDLMTEAGIPFRFNCSLTAENEQDFDAMFELADRYGKALKMAIYMVPPYRRTGVAGVNEGRLSPERAAYYEVLMHFRRDPPGRFRVLAERAAEYREPTEEELQDAAAGEPREMGCLSGRCSFWLDWQGNLSGCGITDRPKFSLKEYTFAEAWKRTVEWTEDMRWSPYCANCANKKLCFSCPAMVFNEIGSFDGRPAYICEKVKYEAQWYRYFLEQLPETDEVPTAEETEHDCPIDEF